MIGEWDILIRLLIAAGLGAVVGFERERSQQPAGLRTHIILVVGSTLAMTLSVNLAIQFQPLVPNGDPARLAAQVISGIGFLGAGAIFRYGVSIKGLTTATSLWTMAVVGLVVGAGHYLAASRRHDPDPDRALCDQHYRVPVCQPLFGGYSDAQRRGPPGFAQRFKETSRKTGCQICAFHHPEEY